MTALHALVAGDRPDAWRALGFEVSADDEVRLGDVAVRLDSAGGGLRAWELRGEGEGDVAGLPTTWTAAPAPAQPGALTLDHVVVLCEALDPVLEGMQAAGGSLRRRGGPPELPRPMAFVRFGSGVIEVTEAPGPARFWGLVAVVEDLDAFVAAADGLIGPPRQAVQPGRRIATVRPEAGLETALALMSPRPAR